MSGGWSARRLIRKPARSTSPALDLATAPSLHHRPHFTRHPPKGLSPRRTCWKQMLREGKKGVWLRLPAKGRAEGCTTTTQLPSSQRTPSHCHRAGQGARRAPGIEKAAACPEHSRGKAASPTMHCGPFYPY